MRSLNKLQWLRKLVIRLKWLYLTRFWRMDIKPTVLFSLSARFDKTNPAGIHIGDFTYVAFDAVILTHDASRSLWADTWIGKQCFIGARSIILPGIRIGDGCIVGCGSVVTADVPPRCAVAGNPARVIATDIEVGEFGILTTTSRGIRRQLIDPVPQEPGR
jgi:acetyltransferase-like isoleucine patch superfamily enzyme